jgi:uncharacterized membrane protein YuzA (DUF378 family)
MKTLDTWTKTLFWVLIVGALNWGLIGFFNWNLVDAILGGGAREETSGAARIIYALVGLAGVLAAVRMLMPAEETRRAGLPQGRTVTP